jgi:hypothetical protein
MTTRKDPPTLMDPFLVFDLRILILELSIMGQQCLYVPQIKGVDSPRLLYSSKLCYFDLRVVNSNPSNCLLDGNASLIIQVMVIDSLTVPLLQPAVP